MAFLLHHSEEQMRASTYGRDAHSAVVSAARTGKPHAQVEPSEKKKLACNLKKLINPKKKKNARRHSSATMSKKEKTFENSSPLGVASQLDQFEPR